MEAIIFIGIQASGKSTFYKERFFNTHMRISLDLLNTRNKERKFLETCFLLHQPFVVDNTNVTKNDRLRYIEPAKYYRYKVIGYFFKSNLQDAMERNSKRLEKENIPVVAIKGTLKKIEMPSYEEGFDKLFSVEILNDKFVIKDWDFPVPYFTKIT